jgi:hypothetical protein
MKPELSNATHHHLLTATKSTEPLQQHQREAERMWKHLKVNKLRDSVATRTAQSGMAILT